MNIAAILRSYIKISPFIFHASVTALSTNKRGRHLQQPGFQLAQTADSVLVSVIKVLKMFLGISLRFFHDIHSDIDLQDFKIFKCHIYAIY